MRKIRFSGWKKNFEKVRKWRMPDLRLRYKLLLYLVTLFCAGMSMVNVIWEDVLPDAAAVAVYSAAGVTFALSCYYIAGTIPRLKWCRSSSIIWTIMIRQCRAVSVMKSAGSSENRSLLWSRSKEAAWSTCRRMHWRYSRILTVEVRQVMLFGSQPDLKGSALLDIGGNVQAVGSRPDGSDWRLGLRNPFGEGNIGVLSVSDCAVVTSGNYERYFVSEDGQVYGHIVDPETGHPVDNLRS